MKSRTIRAGVFAFSAFAAALTIGSPVRGQTPEPSPEAADQESCAGAAWPMIPAHCLEGGRAAPVRFIDNDTAAAEAEAEAYLAHLRLRFEWAFEEE